MSLRSSHSPSFKLLYFFLKFSVSIFFHLIRCYCSFHWRVHTSKCNSRYKLKEKYKTTEKAKGKWSSAKGKQRKWQSHRRDRWYSYSESRFDSILKTPSLVPQLNIVIYLLNCWIVNWSWQSLSEIKSHGSTSSIFARLFDACQFQFVHLFFIIFTIIINSRLTILLFAKCLRWLRLSTVQHVPQDYCFAIIKTIKILSWKISNWIPTFVQRYKCLFECQEICFPNFSNKLQITWSDCS